MDGDVVSDVLGAGAPLLIKRATGDPERVAPLRSQSLAPADVRHPIFRSFGAEVASLGLVQFHTVARISGPSCQTIARFTSGDAAVLDCTAGNGRAIVIASDLNNRWNDFPDSRVVRAVSRSDGAVSVEQRDAGAPNILVGDAPGGVASCSRRRLAEPVAADGRQRRSEGV